MFYLKEFIKTLGHAPIRGAFFVLFSILFSACLTHREWIQKTIDLISPDRMVNPYFVVVLDQSETEAKVKGLLSRLPGVSLIQDDQGGIAKNKIEQLIKELGPDYSVESNFLNLKTLKIKLSPSLSTESLEFIRDQVQMTTSKDHVSISKIKYPEVTAIMKSNPFYQFLADAGDWGVVSIIGTLWVVCFWLCYDIFRSRSYLIEKFQRKNYVAAKTLGIGIFGISLILISFGIWNETLKFFDLIILYMVFSVTWIFTMQEWRWKPGL
jgi:hypothetical protein